MIEVELKIILKEKDPVEEKLISIGFVKERSLVEKDFYYDNAAQEIRGNDKAIRIRETIEETGDRKSEINFKGPKLDCVSASRPEFETQVGNAEAMHKILQALGYEKVEPQVVKRRCLYQRENMTACLDFVENLGSFMELEILVDRESQREAALEKICGIITLLGYDMSDTTARSYLSMLEDRA